MYLLRMVYNEYVLKPLILLDFWHIAVAFWRVYIIINIYSKRKEHIMPAKPSGQIKTSVIKKPQKNGDVYILERKTIYDPEKKYTKVLSTKLVSKIPKGSEIPVPTRPKSEKSQIWMQNQKLYKPKEPMLG